MTKSAKKFYDANGVFGLSTTNMSSNQILNATDNKFLTFSAWVYYPNTAHRGAVLFNQAVGNATMALAHTNSNFTNFIVDNPSGKPIFEIGTNVAPKENVWHHYMLSEDLLNQAGSKLYVDGVDAETVGFSFTDFDATLTIPWSSFDFNFLYAGSNGVGESLGSEYHIADLYLTNEYIDLTVKANRNKFLRRNRPSYLGRLGTFPTGSQPLIYYTGISSAWQTGLNRGSAPNFNVKNTFVNSSKEPVVLA